MKSLPLIVGFIAGFAIATAVGIPAARYAWETNIESDVYLGIEGALTHIEQSAARGDCRQAAAQLKLFNERFASYRKGGLTPSDWWDEVIATTGPSD